jgi:hypothetical protein
MKGAQGQIKKAIQDKIFKQTDGSGQESEEKKSPESIIKGLFGR